MDRVMHRPAAWRPSWLALPNARAILLATVALAALVGFMVGQVGGEEIRAADPELTRMLRMMAAVKLAMAAAAFLAVRWRFGMPIHPALRGAYSVACVMMAAGPGLIWGMSHIVLGAALLHGGLGLLLVLAWRDRAPLQERWRGLPVLGAAGAPRLQDRPTGRRSI